MRRRGSGCVPFRAKARLRLSVRVCGVNSVVSAEHRRKYSGVFQKSTFGLYKFYTTRSVRSAKMHLHYPQSDFKIDRKSPDRRSWHKWEKSIFYPPPPTSVGSPVLSALAELFYFRFNLITQHITHINHHLSACHSIAPPATAIESFLARQRHKLG